MKFTLFHVYTLLAVSLLGCRAVTPEVYWKSLLPNSPMPKSVKDILVSTTEWTEEKFAMVGVGAGGVEVGAGTPGEQTEVGVGRGGVAVHTTHRGKPVCVGVHPGPDPFNYLYAASADQLKDDPNVALFFLENDLHQGGEMKLHFTKVDPSQKTTFLPRNIADSIPFSSNKLPQIYNKFSIKPESPEAEIMKQTLSECEKKGIEGEEKYCATSLESMVDFSTTKLGKKVKAISTEVNAKESRPLQKYKIEGAKQLVADKAVVCHKKNYAYAVFYCHKTVSTRAYVVSLVGVDGTKAKAVAVCHTDTSKWNPKHVAFQVLKVKPGSVPICHFLPEDHVVWVPY